MINYRRFFSINDLIGIRIEDPQVFEAFKHGLLFGLIQEGKVSGIRVDHIDGLYDPEEYLRRLQKGLAGDDGKQGNDGKYYVLVEKILGEGETLPPEWPVSGSTGYDYANMVNGLFIDEQGYLKLQRVFASFSSVELSAADTVYEKKKLVMETLFGGEIENLGFYLGLLASHDRQARDLSRRDLIKVLVEVTACLARLPNLYPQLSRSRSGIRGTWRKPWRKCAEETLPSTLWPLVSCAVCSLWISSLT